jgi:hypothetical protein
MRAHTITTKSRPRRKVRYSLALVLGVCALAIPATASGDSTQPDDGGAVAAGNAHRTPTELAQTTAAGEPSDSSQPGGGAAAGNAHRTATELAQTTAAGEPSGSGGSGVLDSDYPSPNAILRGAHEPSTAEPTFVSDSAGTMGEGFDWASAAVGAGAAMALVALAGAALLTVRRRTAVSPSA